MTTSTAEPAATGRSSWLPMIGLFLAQVMMSFNVAALPVSLGGMVEDFDVAPTVASTTIVVYGLVVAALVMLGAKLGQRIGWLLIFRIVVGVFACSAILMIVSPAVGWAIAGQALAGAATPKQAVPPCRTRRVDDESSASSSRRRALSPGAGR